MDYPLPNGANGNTGDNTEVETPDDPNDDSSSSSEDSFLGIGNIGNITSSYREANVGKYNLLFDIMERDCDHDQRPIIRLDPGDNRNYTSRELRGIRQRDFATRLFLSSISIEFNCAWVRTHHTDVAEITSNLTLIRDYFKAAYTTKNHISAKANLTELLTKMFGMEESTYCSFSMLVASGLSEKGKNTCFEISENMLSHEKKLKIARLRLILLMDILFRKMSIKRLLIEKKKCNIYRLVHCGNKNILSILFVTFSFLIQLCLTVFVVLQIVVRYQETSLDDEREEWIGTCLHVLATLGCLYSFLVAIPEVRATLKLYAVVYKGFGIMAVVDVIVNIVIPIILVGAGYVVVYQEDTFIDAVLNTAALLFIPEIDDQIPALLGFDNNAIIENYLIKEAKNEYNKYLELEDEDVEAIFADSDVFDFDMNSYFITNSVEQGRLAKEHALYQPFIVMKSDEGGHEIDPSNYITEDCLLISLEWKYTVFGANNTTKPRIGYLKVEKLTGEIVVINCEGTHGISVGPSHHLRGGVYMITNFVISSFIMKLRVCGSKGALEFLKGVEYYSLWNISAKAKALLHGMKDSIETTGIQQGSQRRRRSSYYHEFQLDF